MNNEDEEGNQKKEKEKTNFPLFRSFLSGSISANFMSLACPCIVMWICFNCHILSDSRENDHVNIGELNSG